VQRPRQRQVVTRGIGHAEKCQSPDPGAGVALDNLPRLVAEDIKRHPITDVQLGLRRHRVPASGPRLPVVVERQEAIGKHHDQIVLPRATRVRTTQVQHCHDLRGELTAKTLKVTGLCVRRSGLVEHFGLRAHSRHDEIPWSAVVRIEGDRIIVSDASAPTSDRAKRPQRSYARRTK
jgi:hypothetical protein